VQQLLLVSLRAAEPVCKQQTFGDSMYGLRLRVLVEVSEGMMAQEAHCCFS
jgi:hypothetical protein